MLVSRRLGIRREIEVIIKGDSFVWGDKNVTELYRLSVVMVAQICDSTKNY